MAYDLVIKNGKIIDGSGLPGFYGDVAVSGGRIVEIGRVNGEARRVIEADGLVVAPGIIDNHTHYDAQVTWDPLCTYSCYHGVTTVVIGNCSLAMAPAHKEDRDNLAGVLSHVEAIPLEAIQAGVQWSWETIPQYLDALDQRLGLNVASLIGHSAVRRYVMGDCSSGTARDRRRDCYNEGDRPRGNRGGRRGHFIRAQPPSFRLGRKVGADQSRG